MGRPSSCGCCGTVVPSSVCFNTAPYDQTPWVVQAKTANVSGQFIPNDGNSSIIPSGDKIVLRWEIPGAALPTHTFDDICDDAIYSSWYPHSSGGYLSIQFYQCDQYQYEYVITKECYFPSGVKIYGKIAALTSWINAKISLNDGQERIITEFYDSTNQGYSATTCCTEKFCDYNYITTNNSGCYRITVSGSSINRLIGYEEVNIAGSGAIDFFVGVSGIHSSVNARWNCSDYLSLPWFGCNGCNKGTCCTCCDNPEYLGYLHEGLQTESECSGIALINDCGTNWAWSPYLIGTDCGSLHACCIPYANASGSGCLMMTCKQCAEVGGTTNYGLTCSGPGPIITCNFEEFIE